jgi:hypothetical protein
MGLRERVIGRRVTSRTLAANSLLVRVATDENRTTGWGIWFEPTWHLRGPNGVLTGSWQAQNEERGDNNEKSGFQKAAEAVNAVTGKLVENLSFEPLTGDLHLELEGSLLVRTFLSNPDKEELWHIRDYETGLTLFRTGKSFYIREFPPR